MMIGNMTAGTSASFQFISAMHTSANTIIATARNTETNCSSKKVLIRSTSEVQRWMISPVGFCICHFHGRCWMWWYSRSRLVLTSVSPALEL